MVPGIKIRQNVLPKIVLGDPIWGLRRFGGCNPILVRSALIYDRIYILLREGIALHRGERKNIPLMIYYKMYFFIVFNI